ncbi:UDP-N-acetylmuramate dehydrogenase [Desulfogranum japonicum]|uniref:UDP-N-acetylmuramate dehydrogenase n=1 Tax=Desulfogranum japonicum TaxID=231447 RepID=UPI00040B0651|nr:UDP-N-acetylmuramate dehydrogenase [Desulfogranum japonicum]
MALPSFSELSSLRLDVRLDVDMGAFTTLRAGGKAAALVDVHDQPALSALLSWCTNNNVVWHMLGAGSNVLVGPEKFQGIFIRLQGDFRQVVCCSGQSRNVAQQTIRVGAGYSLSRLVALCMKKSWTGMEWASGIPGSVGGALYMNAGAYGSCMGEHIESITCLGDDARVYQLSAEKMEFLYRKTKFPENIVGPSPVILGTTIVLQKGEKQQIRNLCMQLVEKRKQKMPCGAGSAGSFFKNPDGEYAGHLIEHAGLKGKRIGGAQVSFRHANVIVNRGQATAADILALMRIVQDEVKKKSGIDLEPEVQIY